MAARAAGKGGIDLDAYKWTNRLLFIFSPSPAHSDYRSQRQELQGKEGEIADRDLIIPEIFEDGTGRIGETPLGEEAAAYLREKFGVEPGRFAVILVGKDGGEKLREEKSVPAQELFSLIDSMPMRQAELGERGRRGG